MPGRLVTRLIAAALVVGLVSACSDVVDGRIALAGGRGFTPAPDANLHVQGTDGGEFDRVAQNALSDITAFWTQVYPSVSGGKPFTPIKGGYHSYDGARAISSGTLPADLKNLGCRSRNTPEKQVAAALVNNAFYCSVDDLIAWDRVSTHLVAVLAENYGQLITPAVFAHEFGHAIQGPERLDLLGSAPVVLTENQADCASGAFVGWARQGNAPHFRPSATDVDRMLAGYLQVRDEVPQSSADLSHGNGFDRLSAFANGLQHGVAFCFDPKYYDTTVITERPYTTDDDYARGGNMPLAKVLDQSEPKDDGTGGGGFFLDQNRYWGQQARSIGKTWTDVQVKQAPHPACDAASAASEFGYCSQDNTVYYSAAFAKATYYSLETWDAKPPTGDVTLHTGAPADYAVGQMFAIAWGMAVRHQLVGEGVADANSLLAAMCYSGAYARAINVESSDGYVVLSPPDLDEATSVTLNQVGLDQAFGARGTTGLERVQAFVKGYGGGLSVC